VAKSRDSHLWLVDRSNSTTALDASNENNGAELEATPLLEPGWLVSEPESIRHFLIKKRICASRDDCSFFLKPPSDLFTGRESTITETEPLTGMLGLAKLLKLEDWLNEEVSVDSSTLGLGFGTSEKSSTKTNSMTGVHCPGNKEV